MPIVGTSPGAIHLAEERGAFGRVLAEAGLPAPKHGLATSYAEARAIAAEIGYPVLVRPSYVLGGRGMEIVYGDEALEGYIAPGHRRSAPSTRCWSTGSSTTRSRSTSTRSSTARSCSSAASWSTSRRPASTPATPRARCRRSPWATSEIERIREATEAIARGVGVRGLLNIQYALGADILYVLEANPRASRTVPFVSKATATPLAKAAARIMLGETIAELRGAGLLPATGDGGTLPADQPIAVKEAVMPFNRFRTPDGLQVDTVLGPGDEVDRRGDGARRRLRLGLRQVPGRGVRLAPAATDGSSGPGLRVDGQPRQAHDDLPDQGAGRHGLRDPGHPGHRRGAAPQRRARRRSCASTSRVPGEGDQRTTVQRILDGDIDLVVNTPYGSAGGGAARIDGYEIRTAAVMANIPCITTVQGLGAAVQGIEATDPRLDRGAVAPGLVRLR